MQANKLQYDYDDPGARATYEWGTTGRRNYEPRASTRMLVDYLSMGPRRTIQGLYNYYQDRQAKDPLFINPVKKFSQLNTYSMRFGWVERAKRYDEINTQQRLEAEKEFWARARQAIPAMDYSQGQRLRELADKTLEKIQDFIEEKESIEPGPPAGPGQPAMMLKVINKRVDLRAVIEAIKLASQLQRLAAGLDQSQSGITTNFNINMEDLPTEYLDRIINGEPEHEVFSDYIRVVMQRVKQLDSGPVIDEQPASTSPV